MSIKYLIKNNELIKYNHNYQINFFPIIIQQNPMLSYTYIVFHILSSKHTYSIYNTLFIPNK